MVLFLVTLCSIIALLLLFVSGARLFSGRFNMATFGLVGLSVFSLGDVSKYYFIERSTRYVSDSIFVYATILILVSTMVIIFVGYPLGRSTAKKAYSYDNFLSQTVYQFDYRRSIGLALLLTALALFFFLQEGLHKHAYFALLNYCLKASAILFLFGAWLEKSRVLVFFAIVIFLLAAVDSSRRAYIAVFIPAMYLFWCYMNTKRTSKLGISILTIIVVIMIFLFLNFLRSEHDYGAGYNAESRVDNTIEYITTMKSVDTFYNTAYIVKYFPERFNYLYGVTYASVIVGIIPRTIWPGKPVGMAPILGLAQMFGSSEFNHDLWLRSNMYSLSPGFVGEAFANFGLLGVVVLSFVVGFVGGRWDASIRCSHGVPLFKKILLLPVAIVIFRGDFYSATIYTIFIYFFFGVLLLLFQKKKPVSDFSSVSSPAQNKPF